jgi:hypothetical protein
MNGRAAKKIRRLAKKNDMKVAIEFKAWINSLPLRDRLMVAWKAIRREM